MEHTQQQPVRNRRSEAGGVLWIIGVLCLFFLVFLYLGSEPAATVKNTKLFPLFESKKYHQLEKKIDLENKVLLIGDDQDGLGIFIDQYVNERNHLTTIKRRNYHYGKNLEYANDDIFTKGFFFLKKGVASILKEKQNEVTFWVIESDGALNIGDITNINQFAAAHPGDKFLVTAEVAPTKASRYFKVIQYEELPKKFVSELLFKTHKIDKVNAQNLLNSFGGNLQTINNLIEQEDAETNFVESYREQSQELNELLLANNKEVKNFLDQLCKNGQVKAKKQFSFIPSNNQLVRYDHGVYEWRNIKALFAFSDRFNAACTTDVDIDYVPQEYIEESSSFFDWFSAGGNEQPQVEQIVSKDQPKEDTKASNNKQNQKNKNTESSSKTNVKISNNQKKPNNNKSVKVVEIVKKEKVVKKESNENSVTKPIARANTNKANKANKAEKTNNANKPTKTTKATSKTVVITVPDKNKSKKK